MAQLISCYPSSRSLVQWKAHWYAQCLQQKFRWSPHKSRILLSFSWHGVGPCIVIFAGLHFDLMICWKWTIPACLLAPWHPWVGFFVPDSFGSLVHLFHVKEFNVRKVINCAFLIFWIHNWLRILYIYIWYGLISFKRISKIGLTLMLSRTLETINPCPGPTL